MRIFWWIAALAVGASPAAVLAQSGAYRTTRNGQEIAAEAYRWNGDTLDATADVPLADHRIVTRTIYDASYDPLSYDVSILSFGTGARLKDVHVAFEGDSVHWTVKGQTTGGARAVPVPRALMQNLLWSHMAAIAKRLPAGVDSLVLHTFLVDNGAVFNLTLARHGGAVTASVAGTEIMLFPSPDGGLDSAEVPSQGLHIARVPRDSVSASRPIKPAAAPTPPAGVVEEPLDFEDGSQRLAGTLALPAHPDGKVPIVLIVAGSGPTDRNGDNPLGDRAATYRKLAWGLASRGIASLRYDKRGIGASAFSGDPSEVTFGDYVDDVVAGARKLAADPRFSHVVLVGHSEGALLVERAANEGAPVAGVVMMAGMGRSLSAVLREQLSHVLDSAQLAGFDRVLPAYLGNGPMPQVPADLRSLLRPGVRRFLQTESKLDPAGEARRLRVPLLILQGSTDIQVSVADARALEAAQPHAELHILPDANHVFVHIATTNRAAQRAAYMNPSLPLVPELVPLVAEFVKRVAG